MAARLKQQHCLANTASVGMPLDPGVLLLHHIGSRALWLSHPNPKLSARQEITPWNLFLSPWGKPLFLLCEKWWSNRRLQPVVFTCRQCTFYIPFKVYYMALWLIMKLFWNSHGAFLLDMLHLTGRLSCSFHTCNVAQIIATNPWMQVDLHFIQLHHEFSKHPENPTSSFPQKQWAEWSNWEHFLKIEKCSLSNKMTEKWRNTRFFNLASPYQGCPPSRFSSMEISQSNIPSWAPTWSFL